MNSQQKTVVIGVSAGGMEALTVIVKSLPKDFAPAMIIVQHQKEDSDNFLVHYLNERSKIPVVEAEDKQKIGAGRIYIAPPGYHLLVEGDEQFSLSIDAKVSFARPSIDVLFESAADVYAENLIGIILTGANSDGARGLKKIKDAGGTVIVQDPETAHTKAMPLAALALTKADYILPLEKIGPLLYNISGGTKDSKGIT
ncbi:MAG: chemotaxis protein CheB [Deltaproteobacteria bacterium]|nr:chemotaxis protein CheB [Deltaproteobacteria bacterium]